MSNPKKADADQLTALMQTVERLRKERHPDLDPELVREILTLHADAAAVGADVSRDVEKAVELRLVEES